MLLLIILCKHTILLPSGVSWIGFIDLIQGVPVSFRFIANSWIENNLKI
jgi:hypothetical protein